MPEDPPHTKSVWACWEDESEADLYDDLPRLLVIRDDEANDFYAWAATFLGPLRPLSSFVRVLEWSVFRAVFRTVGVKSSLGDLPIAALVGAVLGETMVNATSRGFLDTLPTAAFESTYFASVTRALSLGFNPLVFEMVEHGWHDVREATDQPARLVPRSSLRAVGLVLAQFIAEGSLFSGFYSKVDRSTDRLVAACRELHLEGRISPSLWRSLIKESIHLEPLDEILTLPKERRVEFFELAISDLERASDNDSHVEFLVGYIAQLISGGSLEHAHLILPIQERFPAAMIWYGVCAGLTPGTKILSENGYLGLRIQRRLLRHASLTAHPTCDISYDEFKVLMRGARGTIVRQSHSSTLSVEIAPTVTTVIRWPFKHSDQQTMLLEEDHKDSRITDKLLDLVKNLRSGLEIAESMTAKTNPSQIHKGKRRSNR